MASEEAETYLRLMAESELRRALTLPKARQQPGMFRAGWIEARAASTSSAFFTRTDRSDPSDGMRRLAVAADALVAAGAIDADVARDIVAFHELALSARDRQTWEYGIAPGRRGSAAPPPGVFRAVGIGERVRFGADGRPAEVLMLALVAAPDRAVLAVITKPPPGMDHDRWINEFMDPVRISDDQGTMYRRAMFSGGGDAGESAGQLEFHPAPGPGVRFVDVAFAPEKPAVRIDLDGVQLPPPPITPVDRPDRLDRYFDALAAKMLGNGALWEMKDILHVLLDAGVIEPASPAMRRLVTVGRRLGVELPRELAEVPETELPERWVSVLDHDGAVDGPEGVALATAVLPEFDGTRLVIGGLRSLADRAELRVYGWGAFDQLDGHRTDATLGKFGWWARDDHGRWHVATVTAGAWDKAHADMSLELTPPLHPDATSLDVIITGKTGQVTVTLPLDWRNP